MECVEGETLAKRLEKGPLPLEQVLKYGTQISDALYRAHRSGVVHRDLKPGNIMLAQTGAKLPDFGLAKPAAPLASSATPKSFTGGTYREEDAGLRSHMKLATHYSRPAVRDVLGAGKN
jgi:eukaryotic-like serine/threonine-protein kinase